MKLTLWISIYKQRSKPIVNLVKFGIKSLSIPLIITPILTKREKKKFTRLMLYVKPCLNILKFLLQELQHLH